MSGTGAEVGRRQVSIGLAQIGSRPGEVEANRAASVDAAKELFDRGADVVVLPELSVPWYATAGAELEAVAEPLTGPTVEAWASVATDYGGVTVGGLAERDGEALYNSAVVVGPAGVVAHYRKLHLFAEEKRSFTPGDLGLPVVEVAGGRIGVCICYDLRFVEVVRVLALSGAELICVPTAWVAGFDAQRWDPDGLCPQAHGAVLQANLNQVFMACASQVGRLGRHEFLGSSLLADPFGRRALGPLPGTAEQLEVVTVDLDDAVRAQDRGSLITPRADRRTDVYRLSYEGRLL